MRVQMIPRWGTPAATLRASWRVGRRRRSSAGRSGWSASRRSAAGRRPSQAAPATCSAGCSPSRSWAAIIAVVALGALGGDDGGGPGSPTSASDARVHGRRCPSRQTGDLQGRREGRRLQARQPRDRGRRHEDKEFTAADYKTNPPTSGNHYPDWYEDGIYAPGDVPEARPARPHARARAHRRPVQAGHADRRSSTKLEAFAGRERRATTCCCSRTRPDMDAAGRRDRLDAARSPAPR